MASRWAHDAHCNTIHEAGPEPCPPARDAPHTLAEVLAAAREEGRRQGWAEAIAAMSNRAAVAAWMREHDGGPDAYLADQAPKEETHG